MGWGFYPSVTDLGLERRRDTRRCWNCWKRSGSPAATTCKWLFRTIALTQAYQRPTPTPLPIGRRGRAAPAVCPSAAAARAGLRGAAAGARLRRERQEDPRSRPRFRPRGAAAHRPAQHGLSGVQGEPVHCRTDEVQGTIPQALLMMNSALVQTSTRPPRARRSWPICSPRGRPTTRSWPRCTNACWPASRRRRNRRLAGATSRRSATARRRWKTSSGRW